MIIITGSSVRHNTNHPAGRRPGCLVVSLQHGLYCVDAHRLREYRLFECLDLFGSVFLNSPPDCTWFSSGSDPGTAEPSHLDSLHGPWECEGEVG